jgi:hypothetical protein
MPGLDTNTLQQLITDFFNSGGKQSLNDAARPYEIEELIRAFQNLRTQMGKLVNGLNETQINYSPNTDTYSLSEVISHLISSQGNTYNGFIDAAHSDRPHIDPIPRGPGAGAEKGLTAKILQDRLGKATDDLVLVLRETFNPNDERLTQHPVFGMLSHKGWMLFQLSHDLDHLQQAQTVRRMSGFPRRGL